MVFHMAVHARAITICATENSLYTLKYSTKKKKSEFAPIELVKHEHAIVQHKPERELARELERENVALGFRKKLLLYRVQDHFHRCGE